jgi:hypothetical protein
VLRIEFICAAVTIVIYWTGTSNDAILTVNALVISGLLPESFTVRIVTVCAPTANAADWYIVATPFASEPETENLEG